MRDDKTGARRGEPMVRRRNETLSRIADEILEENLAGNRKPGDPESVGILSLDELRRASRPFPPTRQDFLDTVGRMGGTVAKEKPEDPPDLMGFPVRYMTDAEEKDLGEKSILFGVGRTPLEVVQSGNFVKLKVAP